MPNRHAADKVLVTTWQKAELRDAAKAQAAARGETITDVVRTALQDYVDRGEKP